MAGYLGILKWSLAQQQQQEQKEAEVEQQQDVPPLRPISPERATFLREALAAVAVDPVEEMGKLLNIIMSKKSEEDREKRMNALEELAIFVENLDYAKDFMKIGGMDKMLDIIKNITEEPEIRAGACAVMAACTQNHPETQAKAIELGALNVFRSKLIPGESQSTNSLERIKALTALASLIRENDVATKEFIRNKGIVSLISMIESSFSIGVEDATFLRKALFLLRYLYTIVPVSMVTTISLALNVLVKCASLDDVDIAEHSLQCLESFAYDYFARQRVTPDQVKFVQERIKQNANKSDSLSEIEKSIIRGLETMPPKPGANEPSLRISM